MDKIIRFSVSLPEQLLLELDGKIKSQGYASRSEFTRDLIRDKIVADSWEKANEILIGVLTIVYNHHQNYLMQKITQLQHDAKINILCNTHVHIDHDNCIESIMMKGKAKEIEKFANKMSGLKGVKFSGLTRAAIPEY